MLNTASDINAQVAGICNE